MSSVEEGGELPMTLFAVATCPFVLNERKYEQEWTVLRVTLDHLQGQKRGHGVWRKQASIHDCWHWYCRPPHCPVEVEETEQGGVLSLNFTAMFVMLDGEIHQSIERLILYTQASRYSSSISDSNALEVELRIW